MKTRWILFLFCAHSCRCEQRTYSSRPSLGQHRRGASMPLWVFRLSAVSVCSVWLLWPRLVFRRNLYRSGAIGSTAGMVSTVMSTTAGIRTMAITARLIAASAHSSISTRTKHAMGVAILATRTTTSTPSIALDFLDTAVNTAAATARGNEPAYGGGCFAASTATIQSLTSFPACGAGITPSCCIMLRLSMRIRLSAILPASSRIDHDAPSPQRDDRRQECRENVSRWVPVHVKRDITLSPSTICSETFQ